MKLKWSLALKADKADARAKRDINDSRLEVEAALNLRDFLISTTMMLKWALLSKADEANTFSKTKIKLILIATWRKTLIKTYVETELGTKAE